MRFIDLQAQYRELREPINDRIQTVLNHGQYILGEEVAELESRLARFVGVRHAIAVSSGTDAVMMVLMAYGVGPGDEVITPPFSFVAAAEVISLLGARPVFVDIDRRTYNLDPEMLASSITKRTKVIVPISLYGQCADFDSINSIARKHGIPVIEDGAQSFGATYKGKKSCSLSDVGVTSFFPSKPLGCYGDGGAIFTNDELMAKELREIRAHGQDRRYHHARIGINGRIDTLQAAILLAKLDVFPAEVKKRAEAGARYSTLIEESSAKTNSAICPPFVEEFNSSVYAQYTIAVNDRDSVAKKLAAKSIPTAIHYPEPLHQQPVFKFLNDNRSYTNSEWAARNVISLPMHPYLTQENQIEVVNALVEAVND